MTSGLDLFLYSILAISMILVGIPHGATDILIIKRKHNLKNTILISFVYFAFFILGMLIWKLNSDLFLICLWPASLYHFMDIERQLLKVNRPGFEDVMFFALFSLPCLKWADFNEYIELLGGKIFLDLFMSFQYPVYVIQIILFIYVLRRNILSFGIKKYNLVYLFILILTLFCDLLTSFSLIFIFIHSARHIWLSYQRKSISKQIYLKVLLPISIFSIFSIYLFQYLFTSVDNHHLFFMVGLGSLAFPHMLVEIQLRDAPDHLV